MRVFAAIVCGLALVSTAQAQEPAICTPGVFAPGILGGLASKAGPFTATVRTTFEQRLIDGNVISGEAHSRLAQNSDGWVRQEFVVFCLRDEDGKPRPQLDITVRKSKPNETLRWAEGWRANKEATLLRPIEPTPEERAAQLAKAKAAQPVLRPAPRPERPQMKTEQLGSAIIAGMEANGTRTILTIPPGDEGNSMPLVVITEMWRTKEGLQVRYMTDDPRRGKTTTELEDVIRGEPDASLFAPPVGYKVREQVPVTFVEATTKAP